MTRTARSRSKANRLKPRRVRSLQRFLKAYGTGSEGARLRHQFASRMGTSLPYLIAIAWGYRIASVSMCVKIERATHGLVAREAMAHGRPVVASAVGGLLEAIECIASGGVAIDPQIAADLLRVADPGDLDVLSEREMEVLTLMAAGRSNRSIAGELFLSPKTVEARVSAIFLKLGLCSETDENRRVRAVLTWLDAHA